jgi:hypothetical protein
MLQILYLSEVKTHTLAIQQWHISTFVNQRNVLAVRAALLHTFIDVMFNPIEPTSTLMCPNLLLPLLSPCWSNSIACACVLFLQLSPCCRALTHSSHSPCWCCCCILSTVALLCCTDVSNASYAKLPQHAYSMLLLLHAVCRYTNTTAVYICIATTNAHSNSSSITATHYVILTASVLAIRNSVCCIYHNIEY